MLEIEAGWDRYAEGVLSAGSTCELRGFVGLASGGGAGGGCDRWYERLAERGYEYGPAFQGLQAVWRR